MYKKTAVKNRIMSFIVAAALCVTPAANAYAVEVDASYYEEGDDSYSDWPDGSANQSREEGTDTYSDWGGDTPAQTYDEDLGWGNSGYEDYDSGTSVSTYPESSEEAPAAAVQEAEPAQPDITIQQETTAPAAQEITPPIQVETMAPEAQETAAPEELPVISSSTFDLGASYILISDDPSSDDMIIDYGGTKYKAGGAKQFTLTGSSDENSITVMTDRECSLILEDLTLRSDMPVKMYGNGKVNIEIKGAVELPESKTSVYTSGEGSITMHFSDNAYLTANGEIGTAYENTKITIENGGVYGSGSLSGTGTVIKGGSFGVNIKDAVSADGNKLSAVSITGLEAHQTYLPAITIGGKSYEYGSFTTDENGTATLRLPAGNITVTIGRAMYMAENTESGSTLQAQTMDPPAEAVQETGAAVQETNMEENGEEEASAMAETSEADDETEAADKEEAVSDGENTPIDVEEAEDAAPALPESTFDLYASYVFIYDDPESGELLVEYNGTKYPAGEAREFTFTGSSDENTITVMTDGECSLILEDLALGADSPVKVYGNGKVNIEIRGSVEFAGSGTSVYTSGEGSITMRFSDNAYLTANGEIGTAYENTKITIENGGVYGSGTLSGTGTVIKGGSFSVNAENAMSPAGERLSAVSITGLEAHQTYLPAITIGGQPYEYGSFTTDEEGTATLYLPEGEVSVSIDGAVIYGEASDGIEAEESIPETEYQAADETEADLENTEETEAETKAEETETETEAEETEAETEAEETESETEEEETEAETEEKVLKYADGTIVSSTDSITASAKTKSYVGDLVVELKSANEGNVNAEEIETTTTLTFPAGTVIPELEVEDNKVVSNDSTYIETAAVDNNTEVTITNVESNTDENSITVTTKTSYKEEENASEEKTALVLHGDAVEVEVNEPVYTLSSEVIQENNLEGRLDPGKEYTQEELSKYTFTKDTQLEGIQYPAVEEGSSVSCEMSFTAVSTEEDLDEDQLLFNSEPISMTLTVQALAADPSNCYFKGYETIDPNDTYADVYDGIVKGTGLKDIMKTNVGTFRLRPENNQGYVSGTNDHYTSDEGNEYWRLDEGESVTIRYKDAVGLTIDGKYKTYSVKVKWKSEVAKTYIVDDNGSGNIAGINMGKVSGGGKVSGTVEIEGLPSSLSGTIYLIAMNADMDNHEYWEYNPVFSAARASSHISFSGSGGSIRATGDLNDSSGDATSKFKQCAWFILNPSVNNGNCTFSFSYGKTNTETRWWGSFSSQSEKIHYALTSNSEINQAGSGNYILKKNSYVTEVYALDSKVSIRSIDDLFSENEKRAYNINAWYGQGTYTSGLSKAQQPGGTLNLLSTETYLYAHVTVKKGNLEVTKNITNPSSFSKSKSGWKFRLSGTSYGGDSVSVDATTNANGVATFSDIPVGSYTLSEVSEPGSTAVNTNVWEKAANITNVEITDGNTIKKTMTNTYKTGGLKVTKKITNPSSYNKSLSGWKFRLSGTSTGGDSVSVDATTNASGVATFSNIPVGSYTLSEVSEPGSTTVNANVWEKAVNLTGVAVTYGGTTEKTMTNIYKTGSVKVTKKITNPSSYNKSLSGWKFRLSGTSTGGDSVSVDATTNASGVATFSNIPVGSYTLSEVSEPGSTTVNTNVWEKAVNLTGVTVTYGGTTEKTMTNIYKTGSVKVTKKITNPAYARYNPQFSKTVSGWKFKLSGTSTGGDSVNVEATTNTSGVATFSNIPVGTAYTVTEVSEPNSTTVNTNAWVKASDITGVAVTYGGTTEKTATNIYKTGNLKTTKTIDYNGAKTSTNISDLSLSGYSFRLKGTSYGNDSVNEVRSTDASGVAQWLDIPAGNAYTLSEELSANQSSAFVYQTGNQTVEIKYNTTVEKSATNKLKVANVKIRKTYLDMTDTNYNENGTDHTDEHDNGQWKRNGKDLSGFKFKLTGTPLADSSQTITAYTVTTNADGEAVFNNVPYGTYTLTEELTDAQALIWDKSASKTITINDSTVTKNDSDPSKGTYSASGVVNSSNEVEYLNTLKTGSVSITKSIETAASGEYNVTVENRSSGTTDNQHRYNSSKAGFVFRLNGTSDSGLVEDVYAVTDSSGVATFDNILTATDSNTYDSGNAANTHHYTITEVTGQDLKEAADAGNPSAKYLLKSSWYVDQLDGNASAESGKSPLQSIRQYVTPSEIENVTVAYGDTTLKRASNALIRWTAKFKKQDMESYASLQYQSLKTKATFAGAVYGLYDDDMLIARYTTDANGEFSVTNPSNTNGFILGDNWYVKELSASAGYLIDPVKYYIDATVDDLGNNKNANAPASRDNYLGKNVNVANSSISNVAHITNIDIHGRNAGTREEDGTPIIKILDGAAQSDTVYEPVKKSNVQIWKYAEAASSGTPGHTSIASDPVEGAGFTVFRLDEVVNAYGLYNYASRSDEDILRFLTSRMGNEIHGNYNGLFVDLNIAPARVFSESAISANATEYYSEYYSGLDKTINETAVPSGYAINPSGTAPLTKAYTYTYEDNNGATQTKTFTAENENEYIVAEFFTNSLGLAYSPMLPYGDYLIVETTTPEGMLPVDPVIYHVTEDYNDAAVYGDNGGSKQGLSLTAVDEDTVAYLRIRKTDSVSGQTVQKDGAKFLIYDDDERYVTWRAEKSGVIDKNAFIEEYKAKYTYNGHLLLVNYDDDTTTDENKPGTVNNPYTYTSPGAEDTWVFQTPMMVPTGHYTVVEIGAPDGYVLYTHEGKFRTDESGNTFWEAENISEEKWDNYDKQLTEDDQGMWATDPDMASEERLAEKQIYFSKYNSNYDSSLGEHYVGINWEDDPVVGKISVYVEGEQLSSVGEDTTTVADRVGSDFPGETNAAKRIGTTTYSSGTFKNRTFNWENGPVEGAVFEVRAKANIVSADGRNTVLFNAGQLVTTLKTDENGEAHTGEIETNTGIYKGLPLGRYDITQVTAGNGMVLPEENLTREISIRSKGEEVPIIYKDEAYKEERKTIEIAAGKYDSVTKNFLNGAVIGLVAKEDIKDAAGNVVISAGELVALSETYQDKKAAFYTDKTLPVAEYALIEFSAPTSYQMTEEEIPLYTLDEYATKPSQKEYKFINTSYSDGYKFVDSPIYVYLRLADLDTDAELSNGTFVIKDSQGNDVTTVTTLAHGENIIRGLSANETYTVEQTAAPSGYDLELIVRNDRPLPFEKKQYDGTAYDVYNLHLQSSGKVAAQFTVTGTDTVQVVNVFNKAARAKLVITKHGNVPDLNDTAGRNIENKYPSLIKQRLSELDIIVNDSDYRDITGEAIAYEDAPLRGAVYQIVPTEDIYYPDGITNPDGSTEGTQRPLLRKNTKLTYNGSDEFVTAEDGTVSVVDDSNNYTTVYLFPGTYEITEIKAPSGYHLAAGTEAAKQTVTIGTNDGSQGTPDNNTYTVTFHNDVQTMELELNKTGKAGGREYTAQNSSGEETSAVEGAKYGLFAEDNITNINGRILIGKGVKVDEKTTDANGHISWRTDLPLGNYIAFELEAPAGYCLSDEIVKYEGESYKTDSSVKTLKLTQNVTDDVTITIISLQDLMTEKDLAGTVIKITDMDGNPVSNLSYSSDEGIISELPDGTYTTWLTNKTGTSIYGLIPGETYKITEVKPRENYAYNLYDKDGTALGRHGNRNEYIFTVPEDTPVYRIDLYNKFVVADLTFEKLMEQFHIIADPDGGEEVEFAYTVDGIKRDIRFRLVATEDITHPDGQTGDEGIIYRQGEDKAVRMDVDEYKNWKDAPLAEAATNGDGTGHLTGLFLGKYKLVEVESPDGYIGSEPIEINLTASADNYSQERVPVQPETAIENLYKKVSITLEKRDSETAAPVSGATYGLYSYTTIADEDGNQVQAGEPLQVKTTDENGKIEFEANLPVGYMYYVQERKSPAGYALSDTRYDVDAVYIASSITLLTHKIKAEDDPIGLQIVLMDNDTKVELDDAVISIRKDGTEVYSYHTKHNDNPILWPGDLDLVTGAEYTLEITTPRQGYTNEILTDSAYSDSDLDPASLSKTTARIRIPEGGGVNVVNLFAQPVKGIIRVRKEGNLPKAVQATGKLADLSYVVTGLPGAEYRISPAEGIDHPDGYSNPIEIEDIILTTNENGDAETGLLPLGKYTVTETKAPRGYIRDKSETREPYSIERTVNLKKDYKDNQYNNGDYSLKVTDDHNILFVNKMKLVDIGDDDDPIPDPAEDPTGNLYGLAGLIKVNEDGEPITSEDAVFNLYTAEPVTLAGQTIIDANVLVASGTSDSEGRVRFRLPYADDEEFGRISLPVGRYYATEAGAPHGYYEADSDLRAEYSTGEYEDDDAVKIIRLSQTLKNITTKVTVTVQDDRTHEYLDNVTFRIVDEDGNTVKDNDGNDIVFTTVPGKTEYVYEGVFDPGKTYTLIEEKPANNYTYILRDENCEPIHDEGQVNKLTFTIPNEKYTGDDATKPADIRLPVYNEYITGSTTITKTGDKLVNVNENGSFEYDLQAMDGVVFELYALSDIKHPDGWTERGYGRKLSSDSIQGNLYDQDELVESKETKNGKVSFTNLFPGTYYIVEAGQYDGYAYGTDESRRYEFEIKADPENPYTVQTVTDDGNSFENYRQKVKILVKKYDEETNELIESPATFELRADGNIYTSNGRSVLYRHNETVEEKSTTEGTALFGEDGTLPLHNYTLAETKAPYGYVLNTQTWPIDANYVTTGEDEITITQDVYDEKTKTVVSVLDKRVLTPGYNGDNRNLLGTKVSIYNTKENKYVTPDGSLVDITDPAHIIEITDVRNGSLLIYGLDPGTTYILTEEQPREGYKNNAEIVNKHLWESTISEDGYLSGDDDAISAFDLQPNAGSQYNQVTFTTQNKGGVQVVTIFNDPVRADVLIEKTGDVPAATFQDDAHKVIDKITWSDPDVGIPGAVYELKTAEEITYPDGSGEIVYNKGALVAEVTSGDLEDDSSNGLAIVRNLLPGKYTLSETKAPRGYSRLKGNTGITIDIRKAYLSGYFNDENHRFNEDLKGNNQIKTGTTNTHQKVDIGTDPGDPEDPTDGSQDPERKYKGTAGVYKKDTEGNPVKGATFTLFAADDIIDVNGITIIRSGTEIEKAVTDENGRAVFTTDLPAGKYRVLESQAPAGFYPTEDAVVFDTASNSYDTNDKVQIIRFQGEVTDEQTKTIINVMDRDTLVELDGVLLKLTDEDGNVVSEFDLDGNVVRTFDGIDGGDITTVHEGNIIIRGLEPGKKYLIEEVKPREKYSNEIFIDNNYESRYEKDGYNRDQVRFDKDNIADLYLRKEGRNKVSFVTGSFTTGTDAGFQVVSLFNEQVKATVNVYKEGPVPSVTTEKTVTGTGANKTYQDVVTDINWDTVSGLPGAEFELYAKEDIEHPDGYTGLIASSGDKIADLVTGEDGRDSVSGLTIGSYGIRETKAPEGYTRLRDKNISDKTADIPGIYEQEYAAGNYDNAVSSQTTFFNLNQLTDLGQDYEPEDLWDPRQAVDTDVPDDYIAPNNDKGDPLRDNYKKTGVYKYSSDHGKKMGVANAKFTLYAEEDITDITGKILIYAGTKIETSWSQAGGRTYFNTYSLPAGKYKVVEEEPPAGYYSPAGGKSEVHFDTTTYSQNDEVQVIRLSDSIENELIAVRIFLRDTTTKVELKGASLTVTREDGKVMDSFITQDTDGEGYLIKGMFEPGHEYTVTENFPSNSSYTYILRDENGKELDREKVKFDSDGNIVNGGNHYYFTIDDTAPDSEEPKGEITINLYNSFVTGYAYIHKSGEVLKNFDPDKDDPFGYDSTELTGVKFGLYAAEDIYHPDGKTGGQDPEGNQKPLFKKGELVNMDVQGSNTPAAVETDTKGIATFTGLYPGQYEYREMEDVEGFAKGDSGEGNTISIVPVSLAKQTVQAQEGLIEFTNKRQKVNIRLTKLDKDSSKALSGAEFTLYTGEDIFNEAGEFLVDKDEAITKAVSDKNGLAAFTADLPPAMYYVKETKAPAGYIISSDTTKIDARWRSDGRDTVNIKKDIYNQKTAVSVSKKHDSMLLAGAKLAIFDKTGKKTASWTTSTTPHIVEGLIPGETYTLKELGAPAGYVTAKDVEFTVNGPGSDGKYETQKVEMLDEPTRITIRVNEINAKGQTKRLGNVEWHLETASGKPVKVNGVEQTYTSDPSDDVVIEKIPVGDYKIIIDSVPEGYLNPGATKISVADTTDMQYFHVDIPFTAIEIIAINKDTRKIIRKVRADVTDESGVAYLEDELLTIRKTKVEPGDYTISVTQGPNGYLAPDDKDITVKPISDIQKFYIEFGHTTIRIEAVDEDTGALVKGVMVDILNGNKVPVATNIPLVFAKEYVSSGNYTVVIKSVPAGYRKPDDTEIFVQQIEDLQVFTIPLGTVKANIRAIDAETKDPVSGVYLTLKDPKGESYAKWTTDKKWKLFKPITPGNYLLEAEKVPSKYNLPQAKQLKIENISDMQYFEIELTKKAKSSEKSGNNGRSGSTGGVAGTGVAGSAGGAGAGGSASSAVSRPQTGDDLNLNVLITAASLILILLAAAYVMQRRKKRNSKQQ